MNAQLKGVILSVFLISAVANAQPKARYQLKCYLQLEDKSMGVFQFSSEEKNPMMFAQEVVGQSVFMSDGLTKKIITEVTECVFLDKPFRNHLAKQKDKKTPL